MASVRGRDARFGLALLGAAILMTAAPGAAQPSRAPAESAGDALSRNLRTLAANPRSLHALMGAGRAALDLGDAQAALTFFGRAEEQSPRDGRIKMWMGSALAQLGQPQAALNFFRDAVALGAPEGDVARDRGLAFDLSGDPRRAQRDYELVLRRGSDAEVTRRLALSLAIGGERERALRLLEEQLLVRDRAAERTRALVLALTGDSEGAGRAVRASMPGGQAAAMAPFLARLPALSPADRARAVHLGHFPGDGRTPAPSGAYASLDPALQAGAPDARQPPIARRASPEPLSTAPRRRPGAEEAKAPASGRSTSAPPQAVRRFSPPSSATRPATGGPPTAPPSKPPAASPAEPSAAASEPPAIAAAKPLATAAESPATAVSPPASSSNPTASEPAPSSGAPAAVQPQPGQARQEPDSAAGPSASRLAEIAAALETIGDPEPPAPADSATVSPKPPTSAAPRRPPAARSTPPAAAKKPPPAREPSRHWVQVAGGANRSSLPREFSRLKVKAPKLLGSRAAWTTPANATNRLLVGPFASARDAQSFVNELAKADVAAFAWASETGQKVERLPAK
jgi:Flp pilus assembly protein TadD